MIAGANAAGARAHASLILIGASTLVYEQRPEFNVNLDNNVTISLKSDLLGAYYEVSDPGSTGIVFPSQCVPLDEAQEDIRCPASGIERLFVRLGTGTVYANTTGNVTITAPTPATVTGGSVTDEGGPRTSNITVGPVGGNVIYGNPGPDKLNALNGFADTIHSCPGNVVEADLIDTVMGDCAPPPEPPVSPPPPPTPTPKPTPKPTTPGTAPPLAPGPGQPATTPIAHARSAAIVISYKHPQAILRRRLIQFGVSVAMPMTVRAHGAIALPGRGGTITLTKARARIVKTGAAVAIRLYLPSRRLPQLRHAFARRRQLYATVQVDAADPVSGIEYSVAQLIALVR